MILFNNFQIFYKIKIYNLNFKLASKIIFAKVIYLNILLNSCNKSF